jgi:hypothetical protein
MSAARAVPITELEPPVAVGLSELSSAVPLARDREKSFAIFWASLIFMAVIVACFVVMNWMCCSA